MKAVVLAFVVLAVAAHGEVFKQGNFEFRAGGRVHRVKYSVTQAVPDDAIIALGNQTGIRNETIDCWGGYKLVVQFHTQTTATAFQQMIATKIASEEGAFVTTNARGCNAIDHTSLLLRRVNSVSMSGFPETLIATLHTSPAQYGDVIKDGSISYDSTPEHPLHLCIGVNIGDATTCNTADKPLPVYSHGALSVTCDSCFMGFDTDVFAEFQFKDFTMFTLSAGFKNMKAVGSLDLEMDIAAQQSFLGADKDVWQAGGEDHPVIRFHVGLIPFAIYFDARLHLVADMQCQEAAKANAGVTMEHVIGDNYLTWDPKKKWGHVHGTPTTTFTPTVSGSANFDCSGSVSLVPTLELHMNQLLTSSMSLTPKVTVEVKGDKKGIKICETASYDLEISSSAQMHANLAWGLVHADASWGPLTWGLSKSDSKTYCEGNATTASIVV